VRGKKITTLPILATLIIASMVAIPRASAPIPPPVYLYVDGFDATRLYWTPVGASPYLDAPGDGNYIEGTTDTAQMRWFSFQDITVPSGFGVDKVWLEGYTDGPHNADVDFDIYSEAFNWLGSLYASGSPAWVSPRWTADPASALEPSLLTEAGINAFRILTYFYDPKGFGGAGNIIDCIRIKVEFKPMRPPTTMYVSPPPIINVAPGGSFSIDIMILEVTDLFGYEFKLKFNPTVLQGVDMDPTKIGINMVVGDFFSTYYAWKNTIDNVNGIAWLGVTQPLGTPGGVSGSGQLAAITFNVVGTGAFYLDLYDTKMGDRLAVPISHKVLDGYFANIVDPVVFGADLRYRRSTNRPGEYTFKYPAMGTTQMLYGEIKSLGNVPVQARIKFTGYDETGLREILGYSETVMLQPGEVREVSWGMEVKPDMEGYRYYVTNTCEWDTDGDGLGDVPDGLGTKTASYTFRITKD